ncbi:MAG: OmpA family protein [Arhodomonas sp.]|nr:OmpA family protein [Arhodomonas sp.]
MNTEGPPEPEAVLGRAAGAARAGDLRVCFDSGSAELNAEAQATLDEAAQAARAGEEANVQVEGQHRPGRWGGVQPGALAPARAGGARGLVERGIANDRILLVWYGETRPAVETEDGRRRGRTPRRHPHHAAGGGGQEV